jgi:Flp pilus assembly protein TadD
MAAQRAEGIPTRIPDLTTIGRQLLEAGEYTHAARALRRQLRLVPSDRYARYLLGVARVGLGQPQPARELFLQVASDGTEDSLATLARAGLRRLLGRADQRPPG